MLFWIQVIYCGYFCRFSLFYITFRLLSSVSSIAGFGIIHFLATFTGRSIVHALLFFPYFELLPLLLCFFFTPSVSKNPFWNSPTSLDPVWVLSLLFPRKALFCHSFSFLFSALSVIGFTLMCLEPILPFFMWWSTYTFTFHVAWSPRNSKLEPVTFFAQ